MGATVKVIQCPGCGGSSDPRGEKCSYCGNYLLHLSAWERRAQPVFVGGHYFRSLRRLYQAALLLGAAAMLLIYFVFFNRLSEDELVAISPVWFLLIVFGAGGIYAEKAVVLILEKRAATFHEALLQAARSLAPVLKIGVFILFLIPAMLLGISRRLSSPLLIALIVTIVWAMALYLFLMGIFPSL